MIPKQPHARPPFFSAELRCNRCGSADIVHDRRPRRSRAGQPRLRNRCRTCGSVGPFVPTLADIARACRRLRRASGLLPVSDDDERHFRCWEGQHAPPPADPDDDGGDDSDLDSGFGAGAAKSPT
jgi:hypothetical protein